jgi:hypothetical protein
VSASPKLARFPFLAAALLTFVFFQCPERLAAGEAPSAPAIAGLSAEQKAQLSETLRRVEAQYDPAEQMLRRPFSSPGYHTTLKGGFVHPTRDSLSYAVALLEAGSPDQVKRAEAILRKVIRLQDQDPKSKTYGIWSWFLEEPLAVMSPPDWNWADFCGVQLLQVALFHRADIPPDLAEQVDTAIRHAARSIQRRNVGPGYTNIAIMGAYVTLITAELYKLEDLRAYALERFRRFHAYTLEQGAFTEYNSPTYTIVALQEIGRILAHAKDPEARRMADQLYRLAWQEIAQHFHPPTRQWAGPHSRCYSTLLPEKTLTLFEHATGGRARFFEKDPALEPEQFRLPLRCPDEFAGYFISLSEPRELSRTFLKGANPVVGTTFLTPDFALGSVNRGDLWNQRRALIAYWGTPDKPSYLHLRFLHDGYDFADAQFLSAQKAGTVLGGVVLAVDGGDTHVSLDRIKDQKIRALDLRMRFELGGAAGKTMPPFSELSAGPLRMAFGPLQIRLEVPFARFDNDSAKTETGADEKKGTAWIDVVFYSGPAREFKLDKLQQAAAAFCLSLGSDPGAFPKMTLESQPGSVTLKTSEPALHLKLPTKPAKAADIQKQKT